MKKDKEKVVVMEIKKIEDSKTIYNLTVEKPNIFKADGLYVHNKKSSL